MALLFFMDHLMQKNGRRTIHDLSCQFGARGFSEEMREAVGATQVCTLQRKLCIDFVSNFFHQLRRASLIFCHNFRHFSFWKGIR